MKSSELLQALETSKKIKEIAESPDNLFYIKGLSGSALAVYITAITSIKKGCHIIVADDKDSAAYLYNDLTTLIAHNQALFFPSGYKRSIIYHTEDPSGLVLRTATINALRERESSSEQTSLIICTYPEALAEKVTNKKTLERISLSLHTGQNISQQSVTGKLAEFGFEKTDFVFQPGQYALRGGIIDVFSYTDNKPVRIDFFGDEIDSIRPFDVNTQRSSGKTEEIDIVANLQKTGDNIDRISFVDFINRTQKDKITYWIHSPQYLTEVLINLRNKYIKTAEQQGFSPDSIHNLLTGPEQLLKEMKPAIILRDDPSPKSKASVYTFHTAPQPAFNKNFDLLASRLNDNIENGYRNLIATDNKAQVERLENIFYSLGYKEKIFENIPISLHEGFSDDDLQICLYTDHQIFERYHRYKIDKELPAHEGFTLAELNALHIGDYVVHIDHGIAKYGGLLKSHENGRTIEVIKLVFKDNDTLLVNVHSLHKISKYKDKDCDVPPRINKLGSGAWQKLKNTTKAKVKDIAKDLVALYAKRQLSKGFAFSHDSYMQHELEASFLYEDTPDQQKATAAIKADMERAVPMDRLICGDVGFGKTELAIRAAFKAVCDGKQVAVLVPTTVLALQHYRTFSARLKEFAVQIELFTRAKTRKKAGEIIEETLQGKIDILIGTHKLLSKQLKFKDLGLLIIDEEQKFGVSSKEKLRTLKENVDTLTLTATPIPRTLQFSLMGARDLSVINTPPPNRQPVQTETHVFNENIIQEAIEYELGRNGQVFFVHNNIQTINEIAGRIHHLVPQARIVIGHGQLPSEELEKRMMDFIYGEYDILVATTIIESGIDIPNVNTIIINQAQNFGLSVLHQLRGRVGRTNRKAFCYLLTPPEETISYHARLRLQAIEDFSTLGSGFNIAMQDLDIRGAGNLLGAEQSGYISDIGYETYQKILNEAILELKEEEGILVSGEAEISPNDAGNIFISDCQIDTDAEAYIPDSYIENVNEKIRIYRQIDSITNLDEQKSLVQMLTDRFGELPTPLKTLLEIVMLRRKCIALGFEKAIIKNGMFITHFVYKETSRYYDTDIFRSITQKIGTYPGDRFRIKQKEGKLLLSIRHVNNITEASAILDKLGEDIPEYKKLNI